MEELTLNDVINVVLDVKREINKEMREMKQELKNEMSEMKQELRNVNDRINAIESIQRDMLREQKDTGIIIRTIGDKVGEINGRINSDNYMYS